LFRFLKPLVEVKPETQAGVVLIGGLRAGHVIFRPG
jgi:hypothetical protein